MASIRELRERRLKVDGQMRELVNAAEGADRAFTPEESAKFEELKNEDTALQQRIASQGSLTPTNLANNPYANQLMACAAPQPVASDLDRCVTGFLRNASGHSVLSDEYEAIQRNGIALNASTFNIALNPRRPQIGLRGAIDQPANAGLNTKNPAKAGVLVPSGILASLEKAMLTYGPMLDVASIWTTADGRPTGWPTLNDTENEARLVSEAQEAGDADDLEFKVHMFGSHKLTTGVLKISHELARDSVVDLVAEVGAALGERLGRGMNRLLTLGEGANSPRGLLANVPVGLDSQVTESLMANDLLNLIATIDPAYRASSACCFMMNDQTLNGIWKLTDTTGRYLMSSENGNLEAGSKPMLRGFPVVVNNHLPNAEAGQKAILFGDMSRYRVRLVGNIRLRQLTELYATSDQLGVVAFAELDGALVDAGTGPIKALRIKS